ncbi:MAG TPA: AgmX/PglI C-terminal domain-containing protein, partial [Nannocystaceae bacterium]|nr:AgmX/PglI C-terminal domain-containing protein [Nannocystaceae bacterium]
VWPSRLEGVQAGDEVIVYADLPADVPMRLFVGHHRPITPGERTAERPLLERAWARAKIQHLQARRSALPQHDAERRAKLEREIFALSTKFRVLSDLTALLVLESEADYDRFGIDRNALADILWVADGGLMLMRRTSLAPLPQLASRSGYAAPIDESTATPAALHDAIVPTPQWVASDDEDPWDGVTGIEDGESYGIGGLGLVGTGRGGGGLAQGTIGLGDVAPTGGTDAGFGGRGVRVPSVRMAKAAVTGALDKDLVRRIVRAHLDEVRYCYHLGLVRDPKLRGRIVIQFTIGPTGKVAAAVVQSTTLSDRAVAQCAARAVRRWRFPKPAGGGNVIVSHPFVLQSDGSSRSAVIKPEPPRPLVPISALREEPRADDPYAGALDTVTTALAEGRTGDALATALAWRETDAGNVLALVALGEVAEALGDRATAARAYGSIIDLHPARADLRRYAGARLERLGPAARELAIDTYAKALESRPDHPSSHRAFAYAVLAAGRHEDAARTLDRALESRRIRWERFEGVKRMLRDDLAIVAAAWLASDPQARAEIDGVLARHRLELARAPSTRFVLSWETDANDVDFHIRDAQGGHAFYGERGLLSGGELYADITTGYGPECFAIEGTPTAGPYELSAHYFARGPMGFGMGALQIVVHDGRGGVEIETRPYVITQSGGTAVLGTHTPR